MVVVTLLQPLIGSFSGAPPHIKGKKMNTYKALGLVILLIGVVTLPVFAATPSSGTLAAPTAGQTTSVPFSGGPFTPPLFIPPIPATPFTSGSIGEVTPMILIST
jgi:hypothetical protein